MSLATRLGLAAGLMLSAGCATTNNIANPPSVTIRKTTSINEFLRTKGKRIAEEYRHSSLYPSACQDISRIVATLASREGIQMRVVEGHHMGDFYDDKKIHYHAFNIVKINGEEYVLDFTANQFTKPVYDVEESGIHRLCVEDESKGRDSIPYLGRLSDAREYEITGDMPDSTGLHPDAERILRSIENM